jgi:hypothetical protein
MITYPASTHKKELDDFESNWHNGKDKIAAS